MADREAPGEQLAERVAEEARAGLGIDALRPGQAEAAASVLAGRDTLLVMPTGSGKSAVYQIAASLVPGSTVVVSPLIALQQDQVEALDQADVGPAAAANSTMGAGRRREVFGQLRRGSLEFLFVAPEQLANDETRAELLAAQPSLFVVDEAHCISEWGHDFRPDYLRLGAVIEALGHPVVIALTATASPVVRREIVDRLGLRHAEVVVHGFDRPNIHLAVETHREDGDKRAALVDHVRRLEGPGIVYVATRRQAEDLAGLLAGETGRRVGHYHGGLRSSERSEAQRRFMDGEVDVLVATTAFGMGIDKPDIRFVVHHDVPESLDSYYQEVGRAGRDGEPALALLLWRAEDLGLRKFFAGSGRVAADELERVASQVGQADCPVDAGQLSEGTDMDEGRVERALSRLEDAGVVATSPGGSVTAAGHAVDAPEAARLAADAQESRQRVVASRLDMMRAYCETRGCRRRFLLTYFGEPAAERCGNCDTCERSGDDTPDGGRRRRTEFPEQSRVVHAAFGEGVVLRHEGDSIVVLFDEAGYKTLSLELVRDKDLLRPA